MGGYRTRSGDQGSRWSVGLPLGGSDLLPDQHLLGFVPKVDDPSSGHPERRPLLDSDQRCDA